jgi:FtsZ-interacting cell division protein YlmF
MMMLEPREFRAQRFAQRRLTGINDSDLKEIVSKMQAGNVVILNFEGCSEKDEEKITMFLRGASCSQQGGFSKSGEHVYIITPPDVEIDSGHPSPQESFLPNSAY